MLLGYTSLIGPLSAADADRFVREWNTVAELLAIPRTQLWETAAELRAYVEDQLQAGVVAPVAASRAAARTVLAPPMPWPVLAPMAGVLDFMTTGFLPGGLRRAYGLAWPSSAERCFSRLCALVRGLHGILPRRLRVAPAFDLACRRLATSAALTER
jgi:uncharacterized protein (DUF2236 family)